MDWQPKPFVACALVCLGCSNHHTAKNPDAMGAANHDAMGANNDAMNDAIFVPRCWLDTYSTSGSVELGIGSDSFAPMPSTVTLEYGTQEGYYLEVQALITGLDPGNPTNPLDPSNPLTRFRAWFTNTTPPTPTQQQVNDCGLPTGYAGPTGGPYVLPNGHGMPFTDNVTGPTPLLVLVEVIDDKDNYAMAQQNVTLMPATGGP